VTSPLPLTARRTALVLAALGAGFTLGCPEAQPPAAAPVAAVPAGPSRSPHPVDANEPVLTVVGGLKLPLGRWFDLNAGNYTWVIRLPPGQRFKVAARWNAPGHALLDLAAIDIENDNEWDEAKLIKAQPVATAADGTLSGVIEEVPKSNSSRIRLSRNGNGSGPLSLRIDLIPATPATPPPPIQP
jgi:hypothetical protein